MGIEFPPEEEFQAAANVDLEAAYLDEALTFLRERLAEAIEAEHLSAGAVADIFDTVLRKIGMLRGISAHYIPLPSERANVAHALLTITIAACGAGSRDSKLIARVEARRAARARAGRKLMDRNIVDEVIIEAMQHPKLGGEPSSPAPRAKRVLQSVNQKLREAAEKANLKPPQFKDPDSLRRRYQTAIKRRMAQDSY